jgi:type IV pilus biogenesis protein CpaD/CtpE
MKRRRSPVQAITFVALAGAAGVLAGCGSTPAPHSEYFVITFLPGTPAPAEEGVAALGNAVNDARHSRPREVTIVGAEPSEGAEPALAAARAKAIEAEFTKAGIDPKTIHIAINPALEQDYAARENSFIVTLAYGTPP